MERITLHLTSHGRGEEVPQKSGLNWGQRDVRQNKNEACLNCPEKYNGTFFPPEQKPFRVVTDDGVEFIMKVTGKPAKNLQVDRSLAPLGEYFRKRLKVRLGDPITIDHLKAYGRLDVVFEKRDDYYFMDFSQARKSQPSLAEPTAWLAIAAGSKRDYRGNLGYDDLISETYPWDSKVTYATDIQPGDFIVLWDKKKLLGVSIIESIESSTGEKLQLRCPLCGSHNFYPRKGSKDYKCRPAPRGCGQPFLTPQESSVEVTEYRSFYATWWTDLGGKLSGSQLRGLVIGSERQVSSIRKLNWQLFLEALSDEGTNLTVSAFAQAMDLQSGFRSIAVRARVGQPAFRAGLLEKFGNVCAFTGIQPEEVLEAAHLYSYAKIGEHKESGGLLLRRDIHSLFDRGLLGVDTTSQTLWVSEHLAMFDEYMSLDGASVFVDLNDKERHWLDLHTETYRTT